MKIGAGQYISNPNRVPIAVSGQVPINIEAGNSSWANWAPQLMNVPVRSVEVWATGGTTGIAQVEVFLRRIGSDSKSALRVWQIDTAIDAPAPQGRYLLQLNSRPFPNGEYELFVQATTPSGRKVTQVIMATNYAALHSAALSGAYYPITMQFRIELAIKSRNSFRPNPSGQVRFARCLLLVSAKVKLMAPALRKG